VRTARGFILTTAFVCLASLACALIFTTTIQHSLAAGSTHNCAPLAPPPVSGSPVPPPSTPGIVLFNEILTTPGSRWNCAEPVGTYSVMSDSWAELYNPQNQPFNLYAVRAYIDTGPNTYRFYLPFGSAIAPHGFLVVFPDSASPMLIAGNNLRLIFATTNTTIDQVSVPGLSTDDSYARIPDGSTNWQISTNPTIDASNSATASTTPTPSQGSSGPGSGSPQATATTVLAIGTQPAWYKLSLPQATAAISATTVAGNSSPANTPAPPNSAADLQRRILLTVLLALLAGSIYGCWKAYSS